MTLHPGVIAQYMDPIEGGLTSSGGPPLIGFLVNTPESLIEGGSFGFNIMRGRTYDSRCSVHWDATTKDAADLEGQVSGIEVFDNNESSKSIVVKTVRRTGIQEVRIVTVKLSSPEGCEIDEVTGSDLIFAILDSEGQVDPQDPGLPLASRLIYVNNGAELTAAESTNWANLTTSPPGAKGPLAPGDRVVFKNGTYSGNKTLGAVSGATATNPVVYMAENTGEAFIDGDWIIGGAARWIYGLRFADGKDIVVNGLADDSRISHCLIKAAKDSFGVYVDTGPKRVRIDYNDIDNTLGGAFGVRIVPSASCAHILEYNYIHDNPIEKPGARGISIGTSDAHNAISARCVVQYNRFERWRGLDVKPIEIKSSDNTVTFNFGVVCEGKWYNRGGRRNKWWANWLEDNSDLAIADADNDIRWNVVEFDQALPEDPTFGIRIMAGDTASTQGGTVGPLMAAYGAKVIGNTAALYVGNNPTPVYTVAASGTIVEAHNGLVELQLETGTLQRATTVAPIMIPRRIALEEVGPFAPRTVAPGDQTGLPYAGQRFGMCVPTPGSTAVRFLDAIAIKFTAEYSGAVDSIRFWAKLNQGTELSFSTGNGGEVSVDIVANNPSGDIPTSTILGSTGKQLLSVLSEFPLIPFVSKPVLTRGAVYHAVFKQSKSADGTFSLGMVDHAPMSVPRFPFDLGWAVLLLNNGVWSQGINQAINLLPVFEVAYTDGVVKGQGYLGSDRAAAVVTIGGTAAARQRFMMPLDQIKKTQRVQLWVSRLATGTGDLTVSLRDADGVLKAQTDVPRTAIAVSPLTSRTDPNVSWVDEDWTETTLDKGASYFVELTAPAGANYRIMACLNGEYAAGFQEDKLLWGETAGQVAGMMRAEYQPAGGTWGAWPGSLPADGVDLPILLHTTYVEDVTDPGDGGGGTDPLPDQPDQVAGGKYWPHSGPWFSAGAGIYPIRYGSPLKFITSAPRTGMLTYLSTWWVWDAVLGTSASSQSGGDPPWNLKVEVFLWSGNGVLGSPENPRILLVNPWVVTGRGFISDTNVGGISKMALVSPVSVNLDQQLAWQITNLDASDTGVIGSSTNKFISVRMVSQSKLSTQLIYIPFGKTPPVHSGPAWGDLRYPGLVVPNAGYDLTNVPQQLAWYSDSDSRPWGMSYPATNAGNNRTIRNTNVFRTKLTPAEDVTLGAIWFAASYTVTKPTAPLIIEIRKDSDATLMAKFTLDFAPLTECGWDVTAGVGNPTVYHQNKDGGGTFALLAGVTYQVLVRGPATGAGWRLGYMLVDDYSIQTAANKLAYPWNFNPAGAQAMHGLWPGAITEISITSGTSYPAPNLADPADIVRYRITGGTGPNGISLYATPPMLFDKTDPVVVTPPTDDPTKYNQDLPYGGQYDGCSTMLGQAGNINYWQSVPDGKDPPSAQVAWAAWREACYLIHILEYVKPGVKIKWIQWNNRDDNTGSHHGYSKGNGGEIELAFYKCDSAYQASQVKVGDFLGKTRSLIGPARNDNGWNNWRTEWQQQGGGATDSITAFFQQYPTMELLTPFDPDAAGLKVGDRILVKYLQKSHVEWNSTNHAYAKTYSRSPNGKGPYKYHGQCDAYYTISASSHQFMVPLGLVGYDNGVVTGVAHQGSSSASQPIPTGDYIRVSSSNGYKCRVVLPCLRDGLYMKRIFVWPMRWDTTSTAGGMRIRILEAGLTSVPDNTTDAGTLLHTVDIPAASIPYVTDPKQDTTVTEYQTVSLGTLVPLTKGKVYYIELSSTGAEWTLNCMVRVGMRAKYGLRNSRNLRAKSQWLTGSTWWTIYDGGTNNGNPSSTRFGSLVDIPLMVAYF